MMTSPSKQEIAFIEAARSLECDESEERFNVALGKIARQRPPDEKTKPEKEKAAK